MPWTRDEEDRVAKLEGQFRSLRRDVDDADSVRRRERDEDKREREAFLKSATRTIEAAVQGKLDALKPQLDMVHQVFRINKAQTETLEEVRKEITLARDERIARRTREAADVAQRETDDRERREHRARSSGRWKKAGIAAAFIVPVLVALIAAAASHFR